MSRVWLVALVAILAIGLALAWVLTPLRALVDPRGLLASAEQLTSTAWGIALIVPAFVLLSVAMVPTSILRWATVLALHPVLGVTFMVIGVMCASFIGHAIGDRLGAERMARIGNERFARIRSRLERIGILGMAAIRQVPLGPFMIVNAVAGAARVRRRVFLAGTLVGMVPSTIVMLLAGASLRAWLLA
ncbi:MAG: TVP38/TMEM64 family protein [Kofleriaceae bacterium]